MTIRSIVCCNACETTLVQDAEENRRGLMDRAHNSGWISINRAGHWQNLCPKHDEGAA